MIVLFLRASSFRSEYLITVVELDERRLNNLDHNLLMHLALGVECRVYDFGSRGSQRTELALPPPLPLLHKA